MPGRRAFLEITGFINSPCPKGARCVWSGLAVHYDLTVDGSTVALRAPDSPYQVDMKDSDYTTYAVFIVDTPEGVCAKFKGGASAECFRHLAVRRGSVEGCRAISDARTRGFCLEDVAERQPERPELCAEVANPTQYCRYILAKEKRDRALCAGIVLYKWRERCETEVSLR